jgi:hypothetical protein
MIEWNNGAVRHIPDEELHAYLDQALSRSQCVEIEATSPNVPAVARCGMIRLRSGTALPPCSPVWVPARCAAKLRHIERPLAERRWRRQWTVRAGWCQPDRGSRPRWSVNRVHSQVVRLETEAPIAVAPVAFARSHPMPVPAPFLPFRPPSLSRPVPGKPWHSANDFSPSARQRSGSRTNRPR